jgi:hypothetical protein
VVVALRAINERMVESFIFLSAGGGGQLKTKEKTRVLVKDIKSARWNKRNERSGTKGVERKERKCSKRSGSLDLEGEEVEVERGNTRTKWDQERPSGNNI